MTQASSIRFRSIQALLQSLANAPCYLNPRCKGRYWGMEVGEFVSKLARRQAPPHALNLYAGRSRMAMLRKRNLELYLAEMQARKPRYLLLGEAPGHRGALRTGIPFSCESLLHSHPFFQNRDYVIEPVGEQLQIENSALVVWHVLDKHPLLPIIWNIFPFHPHEPGNPDSNRTPKKSELELGKEILLDLLQVFPVGHIAAVGRKAESMTIRSGSNLPQEVQYIRHPARGGGALFASHLAEFLQKIS